MPDVSSVPNFNLKVLILVHFILVSLSSLGYWSGTSYMFYNLVFVVLLIWGIHVSNSEEPIQMALLVNLISIGLDVFLLAFCFPASHNASERFSVAIAILTLLSRPFSSIFLAKLIQERTGNTGPLTNVNNLFPSARNESYEDIDRPSGSQKDSNYYVTAQQI